MRACRGSRTLQAANKNGPSQRTSQHDSNRQRVASHCIIPHCPATSVRKIIPLTDRHYHSPSQQEPLPLQRVVKRRGEKKGEEKKREGEKKRKKKGEGKKQKRGTSAPTALLKRPVVLLGRRLRRLLPAPPSACQRSCMNRQPKPNNSLNHKQASGGGGVGRFSRFRLGRRTWRSVANMQGKVVLVQHTRGPSDTGCPACSFATIHHAFNVHLGLGIRRFAHARFTFA